MARSEIRPSSLRSRDTVQAIPMEAQLAAGRRARKGGDLSNSSSGERHSTPRVVRQPSEETFNMKQLDDQGTDGMNIREVVLTNGVVTSILF